MIKIKVSEATPLQLDWLVAKCEGLQECMVFGRGSVKDGGFAVPNNHGGYTPVLLKNTHDKWFKQCDGYPWDRDQVIWQPSTDWSQGGPIIEREKLTVGWEESDQEWLARGMYCDWDTFSGPTPLIAAMRCYVASKLGDEVEIPEELK